MHHLLEQKIKEHFFFKLGAGLLINVNRLYCFILVVPKAWKIDSILERKKDRENIYRSKFPSSMSNP